MLIIASVIYVKVYLCRDTSVENSRYIVYSHTQQVMFKVTGKHKSGFERMYINTPQDDCVAKITDTSIAMLRTCHVSSKYGNFHFVVSHTKDRMTITYHGLPFHIRGNIAEKSYDILDVDNSIIACVQKRFKTSSETLELNINDDKYLVHCIASAVCLNLGSTCDVLQLQTT